MEKQICYKAIGIIFTPFITPENIPVQNIGANRIKATIKIFDEFDSGLKDLEGFSHIILLYHLHLVEHF
ncbi:MAG: SAM-dependent methyltransferase [Bacteroidia bacterium]|nr:SAM-dependent methyltransferase [Bacteroidia bacterium]